MEHCSHPFGMQDTRSFHRIVFTGSEDEMHQRHLGSRGEIDHTGLGVLIRHQHVRLNDSHETQLVLVVVVSIVSDHLQQAHNIMVQLHLIPFQLGGEPGLNLGG